MMSSLQRAKGFTLVEVMVAVGVVSIALPALLFSIMQQSDNAAYIRDKSIAEWLAGNIMVETRLAIRAQGKAKNSKKMGRREYVGREWFWTVETKQYEAEMLTSLYAIQIQIRAEESDEDALATLFSAIDLSVGPGSNNQNNSSNSNNSGNQANPNGIGTGGGTGSTSGTPNFGGGTQ